MVLKMIGVARRSWRRLDGTHFSPIALYRAKFSDDAVERGAAQSSSRHYAGFICQRVTRIRRQLHVMVAQRQCSIKLTLVWRLGWADGRL